MSLRTLLVVAMALVFGISAAMGIGLLIKNPHAAGEKVSIVVAAVDVDRFVPLTAAHLSLREIPEDLVPPGAVMQIEDAVDRVSASPIPKQSYLLSHHLSRKGARSVGSAIPPGKCAFPIQGSNVSGFIQPGDRVDVILTFKDKSAEYKSVTILSMIEVMAVNGSLVPLPDQKSDGKEPHSVTLVVTHEQAKDLDGGQRQGSLRLTLRSAGDDQPVPVIRFADLRPEIPLEQPASVEQSDPDDAPQIRTLRGSQTGVVILSKDSGKKKPRNP